MRFPTPGNVSSGNRSLPKSGKPAVGTAPEVAPVLPPAGMTDDDAHFAPDKPCRDHIVRRIRKVPVRRRPAGTAAFEVNPVVARFLPRLRVLSAVGSRSRRRAVRRQGRQEMSGAEGTRNESSGDPRRVPWGPVLFGATLLALLAFFYWLLIYSGGVPAHRG